MCDCNNKDKKTYHDANGTAIDRCSNCTKVYEGGNEMTYFKYVIDVKGNYIDISPVNGIIDNLDEPMIVNDDQIVMYSKELSFTKKQLFTQKTLLMITSSITKMQKLLPLYMTLSSMIRSDILE